MPITSHLFEAYLKCQTKCFLRSLGKTANGNGYSDWVQAQQASYRSEGIKRLKQETAQNEGVTNPIDREDAQSAKWRFAVEITARAQNLESTIHAVEHLTSEGRDKLGLFIPIRFIFTNKLHKDAKLLLAFDASSYPKCWAGRSAWARLSTETIVPYSKSTPAPWLARCGE